jgi:hypothetical protein
MTPQREPLRVSANTSLAGMLSQWLVSYPGRREQRTVRVQDETKFTKEERPELECLERGRAMWRVVTTFVGVLVALSVLAPPCSAQTPPPATGPSTGPSPTTTGPPPGSTSSMSTPSSAAPVPITGTPSGPGKLSPSVGRRLPGMPGGPPLANPMGAGSSAAAILGPLSCDLIADPACL